LQGIDVWAQPACFEYITVLLLPKGDMIGVIFFERLKVSLIFPFGVILLVQEIQSNSGLFLPSETLCDFWIPQQPAVCWDISGMLEFQQKVSRYK
jgi:hypothetical protein